MSIFQGVFRTSLIAAGALALTAGAAYAAPADPAKPATSGRLDKCFYMHDWENWTAASDRDDVMYLRVRMHDVYRVDLAAGTNLLHWPDMHIVNKVFGVDSVCYPIDLDMAISDGHGMYEHLFPKAITKLTPEQVAALPKKDRP